MITLPRTATLSRGQLRAFWLSLCLVIGVTVGLLASVAGPRRGVLAGVSVCAAGAVPGLARPGLARWPYRGWNFGARSVAHAATRYTAWVTHTTAIAPMDPAALDATPGLPLQRDSRWSERSTQPTESYRSPSLDPRHDLEREPALRAAYRWVRATQRPRGRWLVACLALLRWLQPPPDHEEQIDVPSETYTLY